MFAPKIAKPKALELPSGSRTPQLPSVIPRKPATGPGGDPLEQRFSHDLSRVRIFADQRAVRVAAERGTSGGAGPLPHLGEIQRSFGRHDISHVSAYRGSRAAAAARDIGARAYTIGDRVAFAGSPDLHTAAHEAAHAVQQRAGVSLKDDVGEAGDAYERNANAVADRVVHGRSAEALLDQMAPAGSRSLRVRRQVVQRVAIPTNFGDFDTTKYDALGPAGSEHGVDIELTFDPDATKVDAKKIGLTQSVRSQLAGTNVALFPVVRDRMVPSGTGEGSQIDRYGGGKYGNPLYGTAAPGAKDKLSDTPALGNTQLGYNYKDGTTAKHQKAILKDKPTLPGRGNNSGQQFETAALAVEGAQSGVYMGSVSWGWSVDGAGKFTKQALALKTKGNASSEFIAAAKQWNKTFVGGTVKTTADPTNVYDAGYSVAFTVAKGTEVQVTDAAPIHNDITYDNVTIKSGAKAGSTGRVKVDDMKETGGTPVLKLPIHEQPRPGSEVAEVEKAVKVKDYSTAYQILNGQWVKPMLPTLSQLNKKGLLPDLYSNTDQAEGVDLPRLRVAIEAVQHKENKTPLSREFHDWIDPAKNTRAGEIGEIKKFAGVP